MNFEASRGSQVGFENRGKSQRTGAQEKQVGNKENPAKKKWSSSNHFPRINPTTAENLTEGPQRRRRVWITKKRCQGRKEVN